MGKRADRRRFDKTKRLSPASAPLIPRNEVQADILDALDDGEDQIFALGAAGSGKTYIAAAWAANRLSSQMCHKIVLLRPAVEAGEEIGFLPGDMMEKMSGFMAPFFEAFTERMSKAGLRRALEEEVIEVVPVGYARGRTFNNAVVLIDEAQNLTYAQLKMLLTRIGEDSIVIVTGDPRQSDISHKSGLPAFIKMAHRGEVPVFEFGPEHVVRSATCALWTELTEEYEAA